MDVADCPIVASSSGASASAVRAATPSQIMHPIKVITQHTLPLRITAR